MFDLATVNADFFRLHVGSIVALADSEGNVVQTLELRAVKSKPQAGLSNGPRTAFTLVMATSADGAPETGDYCLAHPNFGSCGPLRVVRIFPGHFASPEAIFMVDFN
jgi:hypothetical protein